MTRLIDKVALLHVRDGKILSTRSKGRAKCYLPGGKREAGESDEQTLAREVYEELGVNVIGAQYWGTYQAPADAQPDGADVRITCYAAELDGEPSPHAEIEEIVWLSGDETDAVSLAHQKVFADLAAKAVLNPGQEPRNHAVLFDLDDTLTLTREIKWAHHRHVAKTHYGIDIDDETLRTHWGKPFDVLIGELYQHSASPEEMAAANQESMHLFQKDVMPGAVEALVQLLDAGFPVGVVTSTRTEFALKDMPRLGFPMERLFCVQGSDQSPVHKPDPRVFDNVVPRLRALGCERVTYVGDALMDQQAAEGAGLDFIAVTTGLFPAEEFGDARVVTDITQIPGELL